MGTISSTDLNDLLKESVNHSFNAITVDSDTSTNDACMLSATGVGPKLSVAHAEWPKFKAAVSDVMLRLAQAIVRDAEGATKFITVNVTGGSNEQDSRDVAYAVANSPLVKTAMLSGNCGYQWLSRICSWIIAS